MKIWNLFKDKKNQEGLESVDNYLQLDFTFPRQQLIEKTSFCVLDCETTGLDRNAEIVTIGAVIIQDNKIKLNSVLDQRYQVKDNSMAEIHGEMNSSKKQRSHAELIEKLLKYLGTKPVIGHHVAFDISMINSMISSYHSGFKLKNKRIDTIELAKRTDPINLSRKVGGGGLHLDDLCRGFDIEIENRHTALGDAYMTAQLFIKLAEKLSGRGVKKLHEI